jgi:hypothetical protein
MERLVMTPATNAPHFRDFIILTDFSRCQGPVIGRVSRRFKGMVRKSGNRFSEQIMTRQENGPAATAIRLSR